MKNLSKTFMMTFFGMFFLMAGCVEENDDFQTEDDEETIYSEDRMDADSMDYSTAVAVIHSAEENDIEGTATFQKESDGVRVQADISGLSAGEHGFHIHQYGDCSADDYSSAGGHFNPADNEHDARTDSTRHMGDMGNIEADAGGNATVDYVDSTIEMKDIIGRAVVLHQGRDDLTSQPSGAAGPRLGCGVIGIANTENMSANMNDGNM